MIPLNLLPFKLVFSYIIALICKNAKRCRFVANGFCAIATFTLDPLSTYLQKDNRDYGATWRCKRKPMGFIVNRSEVTLTLLPSYQINQFPTKHVNKTMK